MDASALPRFQVHHGSYTLAIIHTHLNVFCGKQIDIGTRFVDRYGPRRRGLCRQQLAVARPLRTGR